MSSPLVSIVIPVRNGSNYLRQAVCSALAQDYRPVEIIIFDNASTDETPSIAAELVAGSQGLVRQVRNGELVPMGESWSRALALASGDFVKVLCHDDELEPGCVSAQVSALLADPGVGFVACGKVVMGPRGRRLFRKQGLPAGQYGGRVTAVRCLRGISNCVGEPPALLFRRSLLPLIRFDPGLRYFTDLDVVLELLRADVRFRHLHSALYRYRVHGASETMAVKALIQAEYFRLLDKHGAALGFAPGPLFRLYLAVKLWAIVRLRCSVSRLVTRFG